jgi:hypothetical protein
MQQGCCGLVHHSRVAVGRARYDAFEESEHATHARNTIQHRHEVHFARAWIRKARNDSAGKKRTDETLRAVHHGNSNKCAI